MKLLSRLKKELSLVPNSSIQFLDYGFALDPDKPLQKYFLEVQEAGGDGAVSTILRTVLRDTALDSFVDEETRQPATTQAIYRVTAEQALKAFDNTWLPVPFLKLKGLGSAQQSEAYEPGPSNWARMRVTELARPDTNGFTHRITFAFDTRIEQRYDDYLSPSREDVRNESKFALAHALPDNSWFLYSPWVKGWLNQAFEGALTSGRATLPRRRDEQRAECAYWSYYVMLLTGLSQLVNDTAGLAPLPTIRFLDMIEGTTYRANDVDLVLDVGNSRTCGVLIESSGMDRLNPAKSTVLELRDLSRPELAYREPFRSHCEFARPDFGADFWSRQSGRLQSFKWSSLVRAGPEALRLNGKSSGADGDTGLSGPKRYLWDEAESRQQWYFNAAERAQTMQTPVVGEIMEHINNCGDLLSDSATGMGAALQPRFSRASLFTFMVMELLLQALTQINSAAYRHDQGSPNVPRRLRNVVLTIPTATPIIERKLFEKRCQAAAELVWRTLGWAAPGPGLPPKPNVVIAYDEATCTQILYLYTEIVEKMRRAPKDYFDLHAKPIDDTRKALRVASLDIGGGTTDLMIITYTNENGSTELHPQQNFREGFRRAGDDIVEAVLRHNVIPTMEQALAEHGITDPRDLMLELMQDTGKDAMGRQKRKLFVSQVLLQIAFAAIAAYEDGRQVGDSRAEIALGDVLAGAGGLHSAAIEYFQELVAARGVERIPFEDLRLELDFAAIEQTVTFAIGRMIEAMAEVIDRFDCDILLMTGRPSRMPIVRDLILRNMPVPPHRIVFMHNYRPGRWYPFTSRSGMIEDPKTTVAVGALLCTLAEGRRLVGFALGENDLSRDRSTANYIGRIELDDTIEADKVFFGPRQQKAGTEQQQFRVEGPMFIGFRQLPVKRWPGTPLFYLSVPGVDANETQVKRSMPWTVHVQRENTVEDDMVPADALNEGFLIDRIVDQNGEDVPRAWVDVRLQTLRNLDGYWLDTGMIELGG